MACLQESNNYWFISSAVDEMTRKAWINQQLVRLRKTMIRYNTIVFSSKVFLDEYYR